VNEPKPISLLVQGIACSLHDEPTAWVAKEAYDPRATLRHANGTCLFWYSGPFKEGACSGSNVWLAVAGTFDTITVDEERVLYNAIQAFLGGPEAERKAKREQERREANERRAAPHKRYFESLVEPQPQTFPPNMRQTEAVERLKRMRPTELERAKTPKPPWWVKYQRPDGSYPRWVVLICTLLVEGYAP
jgi:hypothetical protein